jgi:hypothetical protein
MIKTVLLWTLVAFVLVLIIFWIFTGGFSSVARTAHTLINPIDLLGTGTTTGSLLRLPWQPADNPARGPDISGYATEADNYAQNMSDNTSASQIKTFGNPSPFVGKVTITDNAAQVSDPQSEYIRIAASGENTAPVVISGWSFQSAISGARAYIKGGTSSFVQGQVNAAQPIALEANDAATITVGQSPVGASFKENICSGYLAQHQTFEPQLPADCPNPSGMAANAPSTVLAEAACMDFIQSIPSCVAPETAPSSLSSTCRTYLGSTFTYEGCVHLYQNQPSFNLHSWRIYLEKSTELWNNSHDTIRLLDDQGRVVDVLTY